MMTVPQFSANAQAGAKKSAHTTKIAGSFRRARSIGGYGRKFLGGASGKLICGDEKAVIGRCWKVREEVLF
jgi:hypothetical protein